MKTRVRGGGNVNHLIDSALALLEGMNAREAAARFGFGINTIGDWRRKRERGVPIAEVRGPNREAIERLLGGLAPKAIPGVEVELRRKV